MTLELGGHAPVLVFGDADLDRPPRWLAEAKFRNAGQVCISPTRFFVQETVVEEFTERFAAQIGRLRWVTAWTPRRPSARSPTTGGSPAMEALVADAVSRGARVITGGTGRERTGTSGSRPC